MKKRILTLIIAMVICFSIISPIFVHAETSTILAPSAVTWNEKTILGESYQITYYYPESCADFIVTDTYIIFYDSKVSHIEEYYFNESQSTPKGTGEFYIYNIGPGAGWPKRTQEQKYAIMQDVLYAPESTNRQSTSTNVNAGNITHIQDANNTLLYGGNYQIGVKYETLTTDVLNGFETLELNYVNWYSNKYGFTPPPATLEPETYFMEGKYYAILSQEAKISGTATNEKGQIISAYGYVDTVETKKDIPIKTTYEYDGEKRGLVYVVISSDEKGEIIGHGSLAKESIGEWFLGVISKIGIWTDIGDMRRNDYDCSTGYVFYNQHQNINRYYFSNIQDACKFVLYGSAGAEPIYEEIGKTDYGYGYVSCEYNNYDLNGFNTKTIQMEQYPLGRQEIILAQHDVIGEGRKFIYIELNYYSRVSMLDSELNLIINNEYMQPEYFVFTQGAETIENAKDKTIYKPDETYKVKRTTTFPIFNSKTTDPTGTWDVIYSTYDYFQIKEGQIIDGDEKPPIIQIGNDGKGNTITLNTDTNIIYKNGETDPYIYNAEKDKYINSKGEEIDLNDYNFPTLEWQDTIKDYQDNFENLADLIEDFTGFINNSTEEIGEITNLLNAVMLSVPSIFRTLILMSFIALIAGRIIKRE